MTILRPGCKINLGLRITGRKPDGYHCLSTFFYPLKFPADELRITAGHADEFSIVCDDPALGGRNNILYKTWETFGNTTGIWRPYSLHLKKRIPSGAGLGGGSSDAAAFLAFLNQKAGRPLANDRLAMLAFSLGADVPFFLWNRPCAASGAGEKLIPCAFRAEDCWLVLVCPEIQAPTAEVFRRWDELDSGDLGLFRLRERDAVQSDVIPGCEIHMDTSSLTKANAPASKTNSASAIDLRNDLEAAALSLWPGLASLKEDLFSLGAEKAAMSGSGASFYGIFACREQAHFAAGRLREYWQRAYCLQFRDFGM